MATRFKMGDVVIRKHSSYDGLWKARGGKFDVPYVVNFLHPSGISVVGVVTQNWDNDNFELVVKGTNEYI